MDEILFPGGNRRRKRRGPTSGDESGELFDFTGNENHALSGSAPYQKGSATSREAARKIGERADDHKAVCYREIVRATRFGDFVTRKEIAARHFNGMQNYVTGRVHDLIHKDNLVYEKPVRINGAIARDSESGEPLIEKRDGSAILVARGILQLELDTESR